MSRRRAAALDTQQLALFDEPAPATASDWPTLDAHTTGAQAVPTPLRPAPGADPAPAASGLAPTVFRHPQADREIRLREHVVAYALRRARRRSIGFIVGTEGLSVNAPKWVGVADIEAALHEKAAWILRKLQEQRERAQRLQSARVDWRDGCSIPFLGEPVSVVLDPRTTGAVLDTESATDLGRSPAPPVGVPRLTLHVGLPHTATPAQIRDAVQSWLQRQARRVFEERCQHYALRLAVRVTRVALSSAQTRWGSASADGSIRLNWRLIHFALPSIDYVVAHELAHLREMNHSPRFWNVVRSVLPEYEQARGSLKDALVPLLD